MAPSFAMKILYLHQYFLTPSDRGGTRSWELARRLVDAGHEVTVITSDRFVDRPTWEVREQAGIEVHRLGVRYDNRQSYRERVAAFLRFATAAGARAHRAGGDLVFATSTPLTIAIPGLYAARRLGVPFVFEVRDLWPDVPIAMGALRNPALIAAARVLERTAYREAAHVVALSPGMRAGVLAQGVPASRTSVIPNACDFELFEVPATAGRSFAETHPELGIGDDGAPLLVYAGTLGKANGASWLVDLAAALAHAAPERGVPTPVIAVVGDGWEEREMNRRARQAGVLGRNFHMLGPKPKAEMPAILSASTAALSTFIDVPALRDNSANKFFDALAAGRPVVVNHEGWIADLIRERACGLVLPRNPERAAAALLDTLADPSWRERAGQAARELGKARFDRDALARELEQTLRRVAAA